MESVKPKSVKKNKKKSSRHSRQSNTDTVESSRDDTKNETNISSSKELSESVNSSPQNSENVSNVEPRTDKADVQASEKEAPCVLENISETIISSCDTTEENIICDDESRNKIGTIEIQLTPENNSVQRTIDSTFHTPKLYPELKDETLYSESDNVPAEEIATDAFSDVKSVDETVENVATCPDQTVASSFETAIQSNEKEIHNETRNVSEAFIQSNSSVEKNAACSSESQNEISENSSSKNERFTAISKEESCDNNCIQNLELSVQSSAVDSTLHTPKLYPELREKENICTESGYAPNAPAEEIAASVSSDVQFFEEIEAAAAASRQAVASCSYDDVLPFSESQLMCLYHNVQLQSNDEVTQTFIDTQRVLENHELYCLLYNYLQCRYRLISTVKRKEAIQQSLNQYKENCWTFSLRQTSNQAKCADGKLLKASESFTVANFDMNCKDEINNCLKDLRQIVNEKYSLHTHEVEMSFLQIETYFYNLLTSNEVFQNIPYNGPVKSYLPEQLHPDAQRAIDNLKSCISILFSFQRRQISDYKFIQETRNWLTKLVSVLLRVASLIDHQFILNHLLRCPAGVSKWAGNFIQPPPPPSFLAHMTEYAPVLGCEQLDLNVTCLASLLLPIAAREDFLQNMKIIPQTPDFQDPNGKNGKDDLWTVVDSDGEEDSNPSTSWLNFQENDLVTFFNQISFADIFRHILFIINKGDIDDYDVTRTSEQSLLKLMAFSTVMLHLFRQGIMTYSTMRYNQFNKRLCQTIRDIVQFVSDHLHIFKSTICRGNDALLLRISVEFDQLFLRAAKAIYSSTCPGAWQFLAELPFTSVSLNMLWKILWMLHQVGESDVLAPELSNWKSQLSDHDSTLALEERLKSLPVSEIFHLLNIFANMASSRDKLDKDFIEAVSLEIFKVTFLSLHTRDACSKEGRNLLASIGIEHTFILSVLLQKTKDNMELLGKMSIYLFSGLYLHLWHPTSADFEIIMSFLQLEASSVSNQLARVILSRLNWSFIPNQDNLFLDPKIHYRVALMITKCCEKYDVERKQLGIISETLKQVTQVASVLSNTLNHEQKFMIWVWEMLPRFHLHFCDRSVLSMNVIDSDVGNEVDDLHKCSSLQHLQNGILSKQPVACYVALMVSTVGHRKSEICTEGFKLLKVLIDNQLYTPALHVISCITPLFYGSPEFIASDTFVSLIKSILIADITYFRMAKKTIADLTYFELTKKMIAPEFPAKILKEFSAMIQICLESATTLEPEYQNRAITLWFTVFTKIPDWNQDNSILFLLDRIICYVFENQSCMLFIKRILQKLHQNCKTHRSSSVVSSIVAWISAPVSSLLASPTLSEFPWFSYAVLEAEEESFHNLWIHLIQILDSEPSILVDAALRKAASSIGMQPPSTKVLPIYRWALHAEAIHSSHPLYPLFWQKFFHLYLQRASTNSGSVAKGSVGMKFFQSSSDVTSLKSMKKSLINARDYHLQQVFIHRSSNNDPNVAEAIEGDVSSGISKHKFIHHERISLLINTFLLWLEEPRLHEAELYLGSLPDQYDTELLKLIVDGNIDRWVQFVNNEQIKAEQLTFCQLWKEVKMPLEVRQNTKLSPRKSRGVEYESVERVINRLLRRLKKYPTPQLPPTVAEFRSPVPIITQDLLTSPKLLRNSLQTDFRILVEQARAFSLRSARLFSLDLDYLEWLPELYHNREKYINVTKNCNKGSLCTGPATIVLKCQEKTLNEGVRYKMEQNRSEYNVVQNEATMPPPPSMTCASIHIENSITVLVRTMKWLMNNPNNCGEFGGKELLMEIGADLFYTMISLTDEESRLFPPTNSFIGSSVDILGKEFIYNNPDHCSTLLKTALENPQMIDVLSSLFKPSCSSIVVFIDMYSSVANLFGSKHTDMMFALLSKFDFAHWLSQSSPKLSERSAALDIISQVLMKLGIYPDENQIMIYDMYKIHMTALFLYQFPDHFGSFLQIYLKGMEIQSINGTFGYDIMNLLGAQFCVYNSQSVETDQLQKITRNFATSQTQLSTLEMEETLQLFASQFMKARVLSADATQHGLYLHYRPYIHSIALFISLMSHTIIADKAANRHSQPLQQVLERVWNDILASFAPWILPIKNDQNECPPWINGDEVLSRFMISRFTECIEYMNEMFNVPKSSLSYLWNLYATVYVPTKCNNYILSICQDHFINLPWNTFFPTLEDIQLMISVVDNSAESIAFLGQIFVQIHWTNLIDFYVQMQAGYELQQIHTCLLQLFVKLSFEDTVWQGGVYQSLLNDAERFCWKLVQYSDYDSTFTSYISNCDPLCVLVDDSSQFQVIRFLQVAGAFSADTELHPENINKQCSFIRNMVRLMNSCSSRHPLSVVKQAVMYKEQILKLLGEVEAIVVSLPLDLQSNYAAQLLTEVFGILNNASMIKLQDLALSTMLLWLSQKCTSRLMISTCIETACLSVASLTHLSLILEECITFILNETTSTHTEKWNCIISTTIIPEISQDKFINECLANCCLLTLYAYIQQEKKKYTSSSQDYMSLIALMVQWCSLSNLSEDNESKMILIYHEILSISLEVLQHKEYEKVVIKMLINFCEPLAKMGEDRTTTGFKGAFGFGKKSSLSVRFRVVCRALTSFIMAQIPKDPNIADSFKIRMSADAPDHLRQKSNITAETIHAHHQLDRLKVNNLYVDVKEVVQYSLTFLYDRKHSYVDVLRLLVELCRLLYRSKNYLQVVFERN